MMGRKRTVNAVLNLPSHLTKRNRRFYLTITHPVTGRRTQVAAGRTLHEALLFRESNGYGPDTRTLPPPNYAKYLWQRARSNATAKKLVFEITQKDVAGLISKGKCDISGMLFDYSRDQALRFRPWAASIDRIDATKGYLLGNCRAVCAYVNLAMNQFGEETFLKVARNTIKHYERRNSAKIVEASRIGEL